MLTIEARFQLWFKGKKQVSFIGYIMLYLIDLQYNMCYFN